MTLVFLKNNEIATIKKLRGETTTINHLMAMGFTPETKIKMIQNNNDALVVEVKGTRIALNREMATSIVVEL